MTSRYKVLTYKELEEEVLKHLREKWGTNDVGQINSPAKVIGEEILLYDVTLKKYWYRIDLEDINTHEKLNEMVFHLTEKEWIDNGNIRRMIEVVRNHYDLQTGKKK